MDAASVDVEQASETVYQSLERDVNFVQTPSSSSVPCSPAAASGSRGQDSLTALSLCSLDQRRLSSYVRTPLSVKVECLKLSPETQAAGVLRSLGLQAGLFHGGRSLCPPQSVGFKGTPDEDGVIAVDRVGPFWLSMDAGVMLWPCRCWNSTC